MIKKYRASTFTEAFIRIKEELGPDAVILKQQEIKHSPHPNEKVEVTVTLEDISETPHVQKAGITRNTEINAGKLTAGYNNKGLKQAVKLSEPDSQLNDKLNESIETVLAEVKKIREEFAATRSDFLEGIRVVRDRIPKEFSSVANELFKSALPAGFVQDLLAEVVLICPASSREESFVREQVKKVLTNRVLIAPRPRLKKNRPFVQMFVGPSGSGKTTTISKLAGRATVTGNPNVAIVTTDCYRMGALEQMEAFASAADIELEKISSPEEVPGVFEKLKSKSFILVDTAGRSLTNEEHKEEINALCDAIHPDEIHLVLPLNYRDKDLERAAKEYEALKINRIVFTRQDYSSEQGALLWLPVKLGIPLSYVSNGQSPDNIITAEKEIIADWLLEVKKWN